MSTWPGGSAMSGAIWQRGESSKLSSLSQGPRSKLYPNCIKATLCRLDPIDKKASWVSLDAEAICVYAKKMDRNSQTQFSVHQEIEQNNYNLQNGWYLGGSPVPSRMLHLRDSQSCKLKTLCQFHPCWRSWTMWPQPHLQMKGRRKFICLLFD